MSFRARLTLFFVLIVVVPMIAVTGLLVQITRESRTGKADARLSEGLSTSLAIYRDNLRQSRSQARLVAGDRRLVGAMRSRNRSAVAGEARRIRASRALVTLTVRDVHGRLLARSGSRHAIATARLLLQSRTGSLGSIEVSDLRARTFLHQVSRLTRREAALVTDSGLEAATVPIGRAPVPVSGGMTVSGIRYRVRSVDLREVSGPARLALLGPAESNTLTGNQAVVAAVLLGFFVIAFGFTLLVMRALQGQVAEMLLAAKRIGDGEFGHEVPVEGGDELAGLAQEFNKMSHRLGDYVAQLRKQQLKLEESIRRVGEAFASGLDRNAILQILVETAVDACNADYGRTAVGDELLMRAEAGATPSGRLAEAVEEAQREAFAGGGFTTAGEAQAQALAMPLDVASDMGPVRRVGAMLIARAGAPFVPAEREMFTYLVSQAVVSIENVELHELVAEQAVTDELTGLSNHRRFQEALRGEIERSSRFNQDLGLVMLDLDNFKAVNDTYGHQQGDEVLRAVARVLRRESREVDEPARYGGEEMAVALPQTDLEGAWQQAERLRVAIDSAEVPMVDGSGTMRVTASFGVASLPYSARDAETLIAAADAALYEAKRGGKNRVQRAPTPSGAPQAPPAT